MFYIWLAIIIILAIIEMATINLVSIWFVISGIIAMIVSLFIDNLFIQVSAFVLGGTILLILTKNAIKKIQKEKIIFRFRYLNIFSVRIRIPGHGIRPILGI